MGALYESAQQSFRLTKPTRVRMCAGHLVWRYCTCQEIIDAVLTEVGVKDELAWLQEYVPPDKDPWRFF